MILLETPTGSGKTTFVQQVLLPYAHAMGRTVLFLSNRSVLDKQFALEISKGEYKDDILSFTYQKFGSMDKRGQEWSRILQAYYWILDEGHYFVADADFNENMEASLSQIRYEGAKHVLIFMSATAEYVYLTMEGLTPQENIPFFSYPYRYDFHQLQSVDALLQYKEQEKRITERVELWKDQCEKWGDVAKGSAEYNALQEFTDNNRNHFQEKFSKIENLSTTSDKFKKYTMKNDFTLINPIYFTKWEEILSEIKSTPDGEKWIIFVRSKAQGNQLKDALYEIGFKSSVFITSASKKASKTSKERSAYESIVSSNKFQERVLIATSVLDNGVNLIDEKLRHVVIDAADRTQFLQMLGRVRRQPGDITPINLYIQDKSVAKIRNTFRAETLDIVRFLAEFSRAKESTEQQIIENRTNDKMRRYLTNGKWKKPYANYLDQTKFSEPTAIPNFVYKYYQISEVASRKLTYTYYSKMAWFERLENGDLHETESSEFPWISQQLSWIDKHYEKTHWVSDKYHNALRKELDQCLELHLDGCMLPEEQKRFKVLIKELASSSRPIYKEAANKKSSIQTVNKTLEFWGYPFRIVSKKMSRNGKQRNYWSVVRASDQR